MRVAVDTVAEALDKTCGIEMEQVHLFRLLDQASRLAHAHRHIDNGDHDPAITPYQLGLEFEEINSFEAIEKIPYALFAHSWLEPGHIGRTMRIFPLHIVCHPFQDEVDIAAAEGLIHGCQAGPVVCCVHLYHSFAKICLFSAERRADAA